MAAIDAHRRDPAEQRGVSNAWAWAGGVAVTLAVLIIGGGSGYVNARRLNADRRLVAHTHEVIGALETLLSTLKDAETGQRGYLLTQDQEYLAPYESALQEVSSELARLQTLTADSPPQRSRLDALAGKIHRRLEELTRTVTLTRNGERVAALAIVRGASGKAMMDEVRRDVAVMERVERDLLQTRDRAAAAAYRTTVAWILIPVFIGVVLIWVLAWLSQRNAKQQVAAALALAEEKERLRTTLGSIGDAVIATDSHGNISYLNAVAETLTGWKNAEARGVPLPQVFHIVNETTRLPVENPALRALSEGVIVGLANHTVLIARSGSERPIDDSAAPIRGPGDELIGCVLVFRDISGRRLAEQQVRHREEQFRRTLDEIAIPTLLHADDDEVLLVNRAWSQITGYGHADIPTIGEWTRRAYGERHASVKRYIDELFESEARVDNGEWEITTASGEKRMWHFYATPVGHEPGGRRLVVSNAIDVTEQRQAEAALRSSEERLRMAQHASRIGTFEWNIQTGVNTWTPELESMYGLQPGGFAGTQSGWEELVHPEDRTRVLRSVGEALANGHFADEWRVVWADGRTHWLTGRGRVFKDAAGNPSRMLGIHIDITERKEGEEKLRQLAAELSEADRRKDEFLATLAHELRNPLAPIRNGLQILQRSGGHHPDYEQVRAVMERQTDQLVRLVDDLMDVSRITRGKLELRKEPVELATVLHQAAETVRPIVESRGQELTITLLPTPAFVDADATRLGQVFANLLNNAAKYSERGRHIWLTVTRNNGEFAVSVRDEGIGIPVHRLSEIFGMFSRSMQLWSSHRPGSESDSLSRSIWWRCTGARSRHTAEVWGTAANSSYACRPCCPSSARAGRWRLTPRRAVPVFRTAFSSPTTTRTRSTPWPCCSTVSATIREPRTMDCRR